MFLSLVIATVLNFSKVIINQSCIQQSVSIHWAQKFLFSFQMVKNKLSTLLPDVFSCLGSMIDCVAVGILQSSIMQKRVSNTSHSNLQQCMRKFILIKLLFSIKKNSLYTMFKNSSENLHLQLLYFQSHGTIS